jgi:hypothetical protein
LKVPYLKEIIKGVNVCSRCLKAVDESDIKYKREEIGGHGHEHEQSKHCVKLHFAALFFIIYFFGGCFLRKGITFIYFGIYALEG